MADELEGSDSPLSLPRYRYATGWYQVAWSDDIAPGDVKKLHYFGQELVCFRGESGQINVLDAHCLHLGAHLGVGGVVKGEMIVCPWHNWHWNGDGSNALIPYSQQKCKPHLRIRSYPVQDWYGLVMVWHDRDAGEPYWQPPRVPELENGRYYPLHPHGRMLNRVKVHPQMIVENAADPYHVGPVHQGDDTATTSFEFKGHHLHATIETVYGKGKPSSWLTPNGPVQASVTYDTYGIGLGFVRFPSEVIGSVQITSHTPVDDEYTDYWFALASEREPGDSGDEPTGRAARFLELQRNVIQQDFFTWENMKYLASPNLTPEEAKDYLALRKWARQFYPADAI